MTINADAKLFTGQVKVVHMLTVNQPIMGDLVTCSLVSSDL